MSQRESVRIWSSSFFSSRVHRVLVAELLLDEAAVDLDVARLVHHLGRAVLLALVPGHAVDDLRGREQRALLAVQELAELPGDRLVAQLLDLARRELLPDRRAVDADACVGQQALLGIDVDATSRGARSAFHWSRFAFS